jgi:hypothetical protein
MMYEESTLDTCVAVICQVPAGGPLVVSYALIAAIAAVGAADAVVVVVTAELAVVVESAELEVVVETRVVVVELVGDEFDEQLAATTASAALNRRAAGRIQRGVLRGTAPPRADSFPRALPIWVACGGVPGSSSIGTNGTSRSTSGLPLLRGRQLAAADTSTTIQYGRFPGIQ